VCLTCGGGTDVVCEILDRTVFARSGRGREYRPRRDRSQTLWEETMYFVQRRCVLSPSCCDGAVLTSVHVYSSL
jgi:hypothetical protein